MSTENTSGVLYILSAPSGTGKTEVTRRLLALFPRLRRSLSCTTRAPRGQERDGEDYSFLDRAHFDDLRKRDAFAEWAEVHGNLYGTLRSRVDRDLAAGYDIIFDIDYQGARQLKTVYPNAVPIMLLPPSMTELEARLRGRGTDAEETIRLRLKNAREELAQYHLFKYLVVNDDLQETIDRIRAIMITQGSRRERNAALAERLLRDD
jgi:guanylate kinase